MLNFYDKKSIRYWIYIEFNLVVIKTGKNEDNLVELNRFKIKNKSRVELLNSLKKVRIYEEFEKVLANFIEN